MNRSTLIRSTTHLKNCFIRNEIIAKAELAMLMQLTRVVTESIKQTGLEINTCTKRYLSRKIEMPFIASLEMFQNNKGKVVVAPNTMKLDHQNRTCPSLHSRLIHLPRLLHRFLNILLHDDADRPLTTKVSSFAQDLLYTVNSGRHLTPKHILLHIYIYIYIYIYISI